MRNARSWAGVTTAKAYAQRAAPACEIVTRQRLFDGDDVLGFVGPVLAVLSVEH
jgi:hypothetical protein